MAYTPGVQKFVPTFHKDTYPSIDPTKSDLNGKTVCITGASKGIGAATAISFAKAGASGIIIGARSPLDQLEKDVLAAAKEAGRPAPNVLALELDVASQASVEAAAKRVAEDFDSKVDIVINNAGYLEEWHPVHETDPGEWWKTWEVNMLGVYLMCRSFIPMLLESESKSIINVSSIGAHRTAVGASAYQTSKFAVCRLTEFLMTEYGEKELIAISTHPGGVDTALARNMPKYMWDRLEDSPSLAGDFFVKLVAERREWLAGRYVSVNWDWDELEARKDDIFERDLLKFRMAM